MKKHEELRQFAAMAMNGLLASKDWRLIPGIVSAVDCDLVISHAIEFAQALIAKLDELEPKCNHAELAKNIEPGYGISCPICGESFIG